MTEIEELEAASDALAARRADRRTAPVVRRAFLAPYCALTLRRYLALEHCDSPVLTGAWPWEDAAAMTSAFCTAWEILYPGRSIPSADSLQESLLMMTSEVTRGFSTLMPMRSRRTAGEGAQLPSHDGIGWVPRLIASALGSGVAIPLDEPLDKLFVLVAAAQANEGMESYGEDYADRELLQSGESHRTGVTEQIGYQPQHEGGQKQHGDEKPADPVNNFPIQSVISTWAQQADGRGDVTATGLHNSLLP